MTGSSKDMALRTVYLPVELDAQLRDLALMRRVSKNELIRELIEKSLPTGKTTLLVGRSAAE